MIRRGGFLFDVADRPEQIPYQGSRVMGGSFALHWPQSPSITKGPSMNGIDMSSKSFKSIHSISMLKAKTSGTKPRKTESKPHKTEGDMSNRPNSSSWLFVDAAFKVVL